MRCFNLVSFGVLIPMAMLLCLRLKNRILLDPQVMFWQDDVNGIGAIHRRCCCF